MTRAETFDAVNNFGSGRNIHGVQTSLTDQTSSSDLFDTMQIALTGQLLDITNGMSDPQNSATYQRLMTLKPDGLTPNAWTVKAGVGRSIFTEIRRHGNPSRETLAKLLAAIDVTLAQFEVGEPMVGTEVRGTGMSVRDVERAWRAPEPAPPVPLVGSAIGGEWHGIDSHIELTELHMAEVLDYLARPPSLVGEREAYAVTIVGDSMAPRFEPGERAFVSPRSPPSIGDDVIVQLRGSSNGDGDQRPQVVMVLIKRLVRRSAAFIELRQFNPDMTFRVPIERVAQIHRVRGRL